MVLGWPSSVCGETGSAKIAKWLADPATEVISSLADQDLSCSSQLNRHLLEVSLARVPVCCQ